MEAHTTTEAGGDGAPQPGLDVSDLSPALTDANRQLWWAAGRLYRWRWFIVGATVLVAVLAVILTLRMPNVYRAETRVLLPSDGGGLLGATLGLPPSAQALLGGTDGGYTRYLAILTSRGVGEEMVERFNLVEVYDLEDTLHPEEVALGTFHEHVAFPISLDYNYLAVEVMDQDPERAASMANYLVERLNEEHIRLTSSSAGERRQFLETRLQEAELALDSAQAELQALQERYGVLEIETQAQAAMSSLAQATGEVQRAQVRYDALLAEFGPDNPQVEAARAAVESARAQVNRLSGGGEAVMPVPLRQLPAVSRRYASVMQEVLTQTEILRAVRPLYEQAVISERRESSAVQVLDPAIPPALKAAPRRSILVILATLTGGLFSCVFVLAWSWWRESGRTLARRVTEAAQA